MLPKLRQDIRIRQGSVSTLALQTMALDDRIEIVTPRLREQLARQTNRTGKRRAVGVARASQFAANEAIVEANVMGDKTSALQALQNLVRQLLE